eukprot:15291101-Ditylum_brightwellii.AAC.1
MGTNVTLSTRIATSLRGTSQKVMIMKVDPKADPDALIVVKNARNKKADTCAKSDMLIQDSSIKI